MSNDIYGIMIQRVDVTTDINKKGLPEVGKLSPYFKFSDQKTKVVHCKKEKYDIYIGRPSKWGNPFIIGRDGTREEVVEKYKKWILEQPQLLSSLEELRGKTLGCWCHPQLCHGDILVELLNNKENN